MQDLQDLKLNAFLHR